MKMKILIIEEDPARGKMLCACLPADMEAVVARSATAAIYLLKRRPSKRSARTALRGSETVAHMLKRAKEKVYAGIVLGYGPEKRPDSESIGSCGTRMSLKP